MNGYAPRKMQRGVALIALLVMIVLAVGYGFYRSANLGLGGPQERDAVQSRLVRAKEALIAYAVNDAVRPGRLLCPDLLGDGNSPLLSRDDCDAYDGGLPWKTLSLAETTDDQGGRFRYALSPLFGGQRNTPLLNSETTTSLRLDVPDGALSNDIAAVVIATRGPLDTRNADGDDYYANGTTSTPKDNDIVVAVTRQELMAAVEQRIANELRSCLEQHAVSNENPEHTYPWPAPLANSIFKGTTGSLFGMVPDTQPGNPGQTLKSTIAKLTDSKNSLNFESTVAERLTAATQLQAQAAYARALFDRLFIVAADLSDKATAAQTAFSSLDTTLAAATGSATKYKALAATLPAAIGTALPTLTALLDSLENSGFDLFLMELQLQNTKLKSRIETATAAPTTANFTKLLKQINLLKDSLLENSATPNADIETALTAAYVAADSANTAVRAAKNDPQQALDEATNLYNANRLIETTILANRINIDAAEVAFRASGVSAALQAAVTAGYDSTALASIVTTLESTHTLVSTLSTGSATLNTLRATSLGSIDSALATTRSGTDHALIRATVETAATQLIALSTALSVHGDNVARETLKALSTSLSSALLSPPANVKAARKLRSNEINAVLYWSGIAISQTADLARLARKGITAQDDNDDSAYKAARRLLASMDGDKDTIALLEKAKANPDDATAQQEALTAFNETLALLTKLLDAANRLDSALDTGMALAAVPTVWYGKACTFLQPGAGISPPWWTAHAWKNLFFYQISNRIRLSSGQLTVNGSGGYRVVTIAAGKTLLTTEPHQNRSVRKIKNYLEQKNADLQPDPDNDGSRDGDAKSPISQFVVETVSPSFNDRLAY